LFKRDKGLYNTFRGLISGTCAIVAEDSGTARHSSSTSEADEDSDSSQAQTSAESEGAESDGDEQTDSLSGAKRLQDLSEDDYEEPAEPRIDVDELVQ